MMVMSGVRCQITTGKRWTENGGVVDGWKWSVRVGDYSFHRSKVLLSKKAAFSSLPLPPAFYVGGGVGVGVEARLGEGVSVGAGVGAGVIAYGMRLGGCGMMGCGFVEA